MYTHGKKCETRSRISLKVSEGKSVREGEGKIVTISILQSKRKARGKNHRDFRISMDGTVRSLQRRTGNVNSEFVLFDHTFYIRIFIYVL